VLHVALATLAAEGVTGFTTRKVAQQAQTSTPAVYELFGDKAGLVREVFFEGFRLLGRHLGRLADSSDPRRDLVSVIEVFREFVRANPVLADVMFSRPFADFDPGPAELRAGAAVREFIVGTSPALHRRWHPARRRHRHRARTGCARPRARGAGGRWLARHVQGIHGRRRSRNTTGH